MTQFLDEKAMREFRPEAFSRRTPFPWNDFAGLLTPEGFHALYKDYPSLELFEAHRGLQRPHGQRPHDRHYLAYEHSIYGHSDHKEAGEVGHADLSPAWQTFMDELKTSEPYRAFIEDLLGVEPLTARYAWHVGVAGSEVSPHRDADNKLGTHIFYFNTHDDWDDAWGGSTLVLGGKKTAALNPDFGDFAAETASDILDNHSFLFKNTPDAWHGVRALTCPEGRHRRLFNVIFHAEDEGRKPRGLGERLRKAFRR
jgi:hypothetical protein